MSADLNMRPVFAAMLLSLVGAAVNAATLEKLTLDDMIQKSTAIVRGRVMSSRVSQSGPLVYTHWKVQVGERWKGEPASTIEVVTPGGTLGGIRQVFPGAPTLVEGAEYVIFLWTGKSRLTHVIGLSQGLFDLKLDGTGNPMLSRSASNEVMLDPKSGREIEDEAVRMRLTELTGRIQSVLGMARR